MNTNLPGRWKACPGPAEVLTIIRDQYSTLDDITKFSTFSPSLYDTAWLSMIPTEHDQNAHLFPQCLEILLQAQQPDGTWPSYAHATDGILVSLAALLSIATKRARGSTSVDEYLTYTQCIESGVVGLNKLLQDWDVDKAIHVGFELLIVSLIQQLRSLSIELVFPGQAKLEQFQQEKLRKCSPDILYGPKLTTLLHSVEAFVGVIDYEKISHHCSEELGIFGSPAATAAYLIHSPEWDHAAERYLRKSVAAYGETGEVPSAFPTPLFELSWATSFMLSPLIDESCFGSVDLSTIVSLFQNVMDQHGSLVGFAPGILADADDTARSLLTLIRMRNLGYEATADVAPLVRKFEAATCFKTYELERNTSFSANCNVLLALLGRGDWLDDQYTPQIEKALTSLLDIVETGDRDIKDKWNISSEYSTMLLFEVMVVVLRQYDAGHVQTTSRDIFTNRIPKIVCRIVSQLLSSQNSDGSWGQSLEVTSYGILGLSHVLRLPWGSSIYGYLNGRIARAKRYLEAEYPQVAKKDYIWIEKTSFQCSLLRMAYCSMALHATVPTEKWSKPIEEVFTYSSSQGSGMKKLFGSLEMLANVPGLLLDLIMVEAKHHTIDLTTGKNTVLTMTDPGKKKYLGYIPVIWLLSNQINKQALSANVITEMLRFSQLTYQIDEYMETTIAALPSNQAAMLESWIKDECSKTTSKSHTNGSTGSEALQNGNRKGSLINGESIANGHPGPLFGIQTTLRAIIQYVLHHPTFLASPALIQQHLATDLSAYLLAHMRQNIDNAALKTNNSSTELPSYFVWARSTGANHTSCPLAFRFFTCLISPSTQPFATAQAQYYISSLAQHLATLCRQYNDYGSIARDAEEHNLNSVDFQEFRVSASATQAKSDLMAIAECERKLMETSFEALKGVVCADEVEKVRVLVDVTDLFGRLYVAKDVTGRKRDAGHLGGEEGAVKRLDSRA